MQRTPLKKRSGRAAERMRRAFGAKAVWVRRMACDYCGAPGPSLAAHVGYTRLAGGDSSDLIPLCQTCEDGFHHTKGRRRMEREHPSGYYEFRARARAWELAWEREWAG